MERMTMRQLNVKLTNKQHEALRRYASRRRTPVAWVIKDYIDNLAGLDSAGRVRAHEPTQLAARGGSFDWLSEEPDLYSEADGEPVGPHRRAQVACGGEPRDSAATTWSW